MISLASTQTHYNPNSTHLLLHSSNTPSAFAEYSQAPMEDHTNFLLDWSNFHRTKSTEELTESLLITTMELEAARFKAQEELRIKEEELTQLKHLLNTAINEKNEAQNRYQKLLLQHHHNNRQTTAPPPHSVSSIDDDPITTGGFSSSDCEESIVSSSVSEPTPRFTPPSPEELRVPAKELPEKGKLLEAVIKAGPLLQNLLLAGPLPHWRHPPPSLDTHRIPPPPVVLPSPPPPPVHRLLWEFNKKRGHPEGSVSCTETKYQRINIS